MLNFKVNVLVARRIGEILLGQRALFEKVNSSNEIRDWQARSSHVSSYLAAGALVVRPQSGTHLERAAQPHDDGFLYSLDAPFEPLLRCSRGSGV